MKKIQADKVDELLLDAISKATESFEKSEEEKSAAAAEVLDLGAAFNALKSEDGAGASHVLLAPGYGESLLTKDVKSTATQSFAQSLSDCSKG